MTLSNVITHSLILLHVEVKGLVDNLHQNRFQFLIFLIHVEDALKSHGSGIAIEAPIELKWREALCVMYFILCVIVSTQSLLF